MWHIEWPLDNFGFSKIRLNSDRPGFSSPIPNKMCNHSQEFHHPRNSSNNITKSTMSVEPLKYGRSEISR